MSMTKPLAAFLVPLLLAASAAQAADKIVAAGNRLSAIAPLYIGIDKGLFAEQGLDVSLVHLTSSQEIALAVVSGSAQFGMTAITAGIYTLAGKGGLKMIAGGYEEHPGFHGVAIVARRHGGCARPGLYAVVSDDLDEMRRALLEHERPQLPA